MYKKIIIIFFVIFFSALKVSAIELVTKEMQTETGIFEDDYLFAGQELDFSGEAEDLYFFGKILNFTGKTRLGTAACGQYIDIAGDVGNGVSAAGQRVKIDGNIKGTTYLSGSEIIVKKDSVINGAVFIGAGNVNIKGRINGNLYVAAGSVNISGVLNGNLRVSAGKVTIENEINGNVNSYGGKIIFGDNGKINGNFTYRAHTKLSEQDLDKIKGEVVFEEKMKKSEKSNFYSYVIKPIFKIAFIISGLLLLLIPVTKRLEEERSPRSFWFSSLWGLIPFFLYPSAIVLSIILIVTIPLAGTLLLAFIPILFVTKVFGAALLGQYMSGLFKWNIVRRHLFFLVGALLYVVLSYIPYFNIVMVIFLSCLGWSYLLSPLFKKKIAV